MEEQILEERDERQDEEISKIGILWKKLKKIAILTIVLLVGYFLIFGTYGTCRILILHWQIWQTEQKISVTRARKLVLEREVKLLTEDKDYVKKVAKERFGIE